MKSKLFQTICLQSHYSALQGFSGQNILSGVRWEGLDMGWFCCDPSANSDSTPRKTYLGPPKPDPKLGQVPSKPRHLGIVLFCQISLFFRVFLLCQRVLERERERERCSGLLVKSRSQKFIVTSGICFLRIVSPH